MIFNMVGGGAGGGIVLNVTRAATLPETVVDDQIIIIGNNAPPQITVDTVAPTAPMLYDVWIEIADATNAVKLDNSSLRLNIRPKKVRQYDGMRFAAVDAYLGVSGVWVQISSAITIMGVSHNTSDPSPILTRLGEAVGKNTVAGIGSTPQISDFDSMPIYRDIKLCNLAADGTVNAYEGDAGFKRDGTNGDVMVEIPAFYYKIVPGTIEEWWISDGPAEGFVKHPAFARGVPYADLEKIYVSAYETSAGYISKTGMTPLVSITRAEARIGSANKGTGWSQLDVATVMAINLLIYIEYATLDLQRAIGAGVTKASASTITGTSDTMAGHTGNATGDNGYVAIKWRHIENWWGNEGVYVDGLNINNGSYYWCLLPSHFADNTTSNYTLSGYSVPTNLNKTYIKSMGLDVSHPWFRLPLAGSSSASTYYCDYCTSYTGWCIPAFGGYYAVVIDGGGGPACWLMYYNSSSSGADTTARLLYLPQSA